MNEVLRVSLKIAYYVLCISPLRFKDVEIFFKYENVE